MKKVFGKVWHFIWEDDSMLSWLVNVVLAFVLVKFIVYPLLGLMLGTGYPVVAVISSSMEHNGLGFDDWWDANKDWYLQHDISRSDLGDASFRNGFNKGDIILLVGTDQEDLEEFNVVVYNSDKYKYPIIHRVVQIDNSDSYVFTTKGDNNPVADPADVMPEQVLGRAVFKIPFLGWIKILFTDILEWMRLMLTEMGGM